MALPGRELKVDVSVVPNTNLKILKNMKRNEVECAINPISNSNKIVAFCKRSLSKVSKINSNLQASLSIRLPWIQKADETCMKEIAFLRRYNQYFLRFFEPHFNSRIFEGCIVPPSVKNLTTPLSSITNALTITWVMVKRGYGRTDNNCEWKITDGWHSWKDGRTERRTS